MLRASLGRRSAISSNTMLNMNGSDMRKHRVKMNREVGMWLYKEPTMKAFMGWCALQQVKARGRVRITSAQDYARCLRTTLKPTAPGTALVTAPMHCGLNFLTITQLMHATSDHKFPLEINWMNWNERLRFLPGAATHDIVSAGWLVRMACMEDPKWQKYCNWLLEDTTGRDGIANGVTKERGDDNHAFDECISHMAFDSGEEAEDFIEMVFRAIAAFMLRAVPVDARVIAQQIAGTTFHKLSPGELFVPTLIPLMDCCPQREDGLHNAMVEFFTADDLHTRGKGICQDLGIPIEDVDERLIGDKGLFALRALEELEDGSYVTLRGWPKTPQKDNETIGGQVMDMTRMHNNDLL